VRGVGFLADYLDDVVVVADVVTTREVVLHPL